MHDGVVRIVLTRRLVTGGPATTPTSPSVPRAARRGVGVLLALVVLLLGRGARFGGTGGVAALGFGGHRVRFVLRRGRSFGRLPVRSLVVVGNPPASAPTTAPAAPTGARIIVTLVGALGVAGLGIPGLGIADLGVVGLDIPG